MSEQPAEERLDLIERGGRSVEEVVEHARMLRRLAGRIARIGGWSIEIPSNEVRWTAETFAILEWEADLEPGLDHAVTTVYRDPGRIAAAIEACATDGTPFDLEVEASTFSGRPIWVRVVGEPQYGPDGSVVRVVGAFQDVTDAKRAAQQNAELGERLRITLDSISDPFFTLDEQWRFTFINGPAERLVDRDRAELIGRTIFEAFPGVNGTAFEDAYRRAVREQVTVTVEGEYYEPLDMPLDLTIYPSPSGLAAYFTNARDRLTRERRWQRLAESEQAAAEQLRELDRIKNAFLSAVSHELRTPLTVVQGMAATLQRLRDELGPGQRHDLEDALVVHADRLAQLLEDLLDIDRLTNGAVVIEPTTVDVVAIVHRLVAQRGDEQSVVLDLPDQLLALVDATQFERIVVNLLTNAAKYAPAGEVRLALERLGARGVAIDVRDRGPGIPAAERERVFEPFYRGPDDLPQPGTGVGLAMVAAFAELHGGRAVVLDATDGAHLRVELPGTRDAQRATTVSTS